MPKLFKRYYSKLQHAVVVICMLFALKKSGRKKNTTKHSLTKLMDIFIYVFSSINFRFSLFYFVVFIFLLQHLPFFVNLYHIKSVNSVIFPQIG